ncbi:hypothetical protein D3C87_2125820 [compost metagenome]
MASFLLPLWTIEAFSLSAGPVCVPGDCRFAAVLLLPSCRMKAFEWFTDVWTLAAALLLPS